MCNMMEKLRYFLCCSSTDDDDSNTDYVASGGNTTPICEKRIYQPLTYQITHSSGTGQLEDPPPTYNCFNFNKKNT